MREKDFTQLAAKIMLVKVLNNFWPCCQTCLLYHVGFGCYHKRARIGYIVEIDKKDNKPIIRWRKDTSGICKYYEKEK